MTSRVAFLSLLVGLALFALAPAARAGEPIDDTVLLDPFDPVPEIQFHHLGDCYAGCSFGRDCYRGCGERYRCYRDCHRHCERNCRDRDYRDGRYSDEDRYRRDHEHFRRDEARFREDTSVYEDQAERYENRYGDEDHHHHHHHHHEGDPNWHDNAAPYDEDDNGAGYDDEGGEYGPPPGAVPPGAIPPGAVAAPPPPGPPPVRH
jgi:hypothetical protein